MAYVKIDKKVIKPLELLIQCIEMFCLMMKLLPPHLELQFGMQFMDISQVVWKLIRHIVNYLFSVINKIIT